MRCVTSNDASREGIAAPQQAGIGQQTGQPFLSLPAEAGNPLERILWGGPAAGRSGITASLTHCPSRVFAPRDAEPRAVRGAPRPPILAPRAGNPVSA